MFGKQNKKKTEEKIMEKPRGFNYNSLTSNIGESIKNIKKKVYIVLKARLLKKEVKWKWVR